MRSQAGLTLVELLLALVITTIIVGPLTAWAILVLDQRDSSQNELGRVNAMGLLNSYLPRDVASAKFVTAGGDECAGSPVGSVTELELVPAGGERRVVYSEGPASDPGGTVTTSLWRHVCDAGGNLTTSAELVRGIHAGRTEVRCFGPGGEGACDVDANRQVQLTVVPLDQTGTDARAMQLRLTRRTSSTSAGAPSTSNRHPLARIDVSPSVGYGSTTFTISGSRSSDPDGSIAAYDWTFPAGTACSASPSGDVQTCRFPGSGSQLVQLQVTDDGGSTNAATRTVFVLNQFPIAKAAVSPASGTVGATQFTFDAGASSDPDGDPLTYRWDLGEDLGAARYLTGPRPTFTFPAGTLAGRRQVTLVATDSHGANDAAVVVVDLANAGGGGGGGGGGQTQIGDIVVSPGLVNGIGLPRIPDPVGAGLPARTVSFSSASAPPAGATVSWELRRHGTSTVVASGTGATLTHDFGPGAGGEYDIVRTLSSDPANPQTVPFRVNAAPIASFTASPPTGAAPLDVAFDSSGSSDADGSIVSYRWYFGFFDKWTSSDPNPPKTFTDPGTYQVILVVTDSDGAVTSFSRTITLTGTPAAPAGLTWDGSTLRWTAVPGATSYKVTLNYDACQQSNVVMVNPLAAPSVDVPSSQAVCGAPGTVTAFVSTVANQATSPPAQQVKF